MEFRRNSHSDERRRRVLIEETGLQPLEPAAAPRAAESAVPVKSYSEAALSSRQVRLVDLIPTRRWTLLLLGLLALSVAAGLEAAYGQVALGYIPLRLAQVPAVDLTAAGSVADWFGGCLLFAAAGLGILTYLLRRHRVDDYRGRYRMWYWVVPLLVLASADQVCDLQSSLRALVLALAGIPDHADALWIWSLAITVITLGVVVRLAFEMRACRLAIGALVVGWACLAAWQAVTLDWMLAPRGVLRDMVLAGLMLLGTIHQFLAMCLYSRHVYRDACGEIPLTPRVAKAPRRARRARRESPKPTPAPAASPAVAVTPTLVPKESKESKEVKDFKEVRETKVRVDQAHSDVASAPVAKPTLARSTTEPSRENPRQREPVLTLAKHTTAELQSDDDDEADDSGLSKAERRRQRKLQRREKRQS